MYVLPIDMDKSNQADSGSRGRGEKFFKAKSIRQWLAKAKYLTLIKQSPPSKDRGAIVKSID